MYGRGRLLMMIGDHQRRISGEGRNSLGRVEGWLFTKRGKVRRSDNASKGLSTSGV